MEITLADLKIISDNRGFNIVLVEKDYVLTYLLFLLKDVKGIYFKGGTALNKIFFNYKRLSEDLDFTVTRNLTEVEKDIKDKLAGTMFAQITHDKKVDQFIRLIVHYQLFHDNGTIFIDLNEKGKVLLKPEQHSVMHFYQEFIPEFSVSTLNFKEMIAEKMAAAIGRNKPRDHFDLYSMVGQKIPIDYEIVKEKCRDSGDEFSITKMFNNAKKLKNRWDSDMAPLISDKVTFQEVMKTLAKHFKYAEEKERLKKNS